MIILLGILFTIGGVLYIYHLIIKKPEDIWDKTMMLKGYVGGVGLTLVGLALIFSQL